MIWCQYFQLEVLWEFLVDLEMVDQLIIHGATLVQWREMLCP